MASAPKPSRGPHGKTKPKVKAKPKVDDAQLGPDDGDVMPLGPERPDGGAGMEPLGGSSDPLGPGPGAGSTGGQG
jgi:hypothetical protein